MLGRKDKVSNDPLASLGITNLAISEDCTCWGSSVLSGVDSVGLGGSDSDD